MATINKINVNSAEYDLIGSVFYGSCSTAAGIVAKTASINGKFTLYTGATVAIKFTATNTATNPTLNIDPQVRIRVRSRRASKPTGFSMTGSPAP